MEVKEVEELKLHTIQLLTPERSDSSSTSF